MEKTKKLYFNKKQRNFLFSDAILEDDDMWVKIIEHISELEFKLFLAYAYSKDGRMTEKKAFKYLYECKAFLNMALFNKQIKISLL